MTKTGVFITFEGIEGSGKSTQLPRLAEWLTSRGADVEVTREPGGTPLGAALRSLLLDPLNSGMAPEAELFLYLADRAQNVRERIRPALERGAIVLCDRHTDATLVYQGVMRGLGIPHLVALNRTATGGLAPDRTLLFDMPAEAGLSRAANRGTGHGGPGDRIENEPLEFHRGVREAYLELARAEPDRFAVIPASGDSGSVHAAVRSAVGEWLSGWFDR
jgi:dTMP kinase